MITLKFNSASMMHMDGTDRIVLVLDDYADKIAAKKFVAELGGKPHVAQLKRYMKKRTHTANSYFWVLAGKLAEVVGIPKIEIYRDYVRNIGGNSRTVPIPDDGVAEWIRWWQNKGLGWVCENAGASKIDGYTNIICYVGSSEYRVDQMARLIDLMVFDCREQGIETMPPDKLSLLIDDWGKNEAQTNKGAGD